jgi:type I restriction enzyme S subunit
MISSTAVSNRRGMEWPSVPLGEAVSFISGFAFDSNEFNTNGNGIPIIRIRDVVRGYSETFYSGTYDDRYQVHDGDYLIGMDGEFNLAQWKGGKAALNQRVCKLDEVSPEFDRDFIAWFLPQALKKIEDATPFVTVKHLSVKDLIKVKIPRPPLPEQERIAGILDKADGVRRKRKEALRLTDELLRSVFLEMFGDPVTNPKGWPDKTSLGEVAELVSGITKGRQLNGKTTREVPYLAVANVQDRHLKLDAVKRIEATEEEIQRYKIRRNDLLLTEGGDPDKLGRGSLWREEIPECIHQNHIFRIRLTDSSIDPVFLNWLVGSSRGKRYFLRSAKQTTGIASINMTQLRAFPLLSPPIELQQQLSRIVFSVEDSKMKLQEALAQAEYCFAALQQRAFGGQL